MGFGPEVASDSELLFWLSGGDERAYRDLYQRYATRIYAVALAAVRDTWDAEDVVAATFLELWRKRDNVRLVDESVLPWLLTVVAYSAKNKLRSRVRYRRLLSRLPHQRDEPDHADEVARVADGEALSAEVQALLLSLNARDSSVVLLCIMQELSTADLLGRHRGGAGSRRRGDREKRNRECSREKWDGSVHVKAPN